MTGLRRAFIGLSIAWMALLPLAAFTASHPTTVWPGQRLMALLIYQVGSFVCHQRPERSFVLFGVPLPVCARCTGIYAGAALMALFATIRRGRTVRLAAVQSEVRLKPDATPESRRAVRLQAGQSDATPESRRGVRLQADPGPMRAVLIASALPTAATLVYEWSTGWMPGHWIRATSGVVLGCAVAWIVVSATSSGRGNVID